MGSIISMIIFTVGVSMIVKGVDLFIDAATWIAERTGISAGIIGATIISIATTLPEFFVSTVASTEGLSGMAVGNALGSYTCNIALIIGVCSLVKPIRIKDSFFAIKGIMMLAYLCVFFILSRNGIIAHREGCLLIGLVIFFLGVNILEHRNKNRNTEDKKKGHIRLRDIIINGIKFALGSFFTVYGAHLLVDSGVEIANILRIPKQIISLTLLAIGTSLPELATGLAATIKGQQSISIGNVLGSNIINMSIVMGASTLVSKQGLIISRQTLIMDIPMAMLVSILFIIAGICREGVGRLVGASLLGIYIFYLLIIF